MEVNRSLSDLRQSWTCAMLPRRSPPKIEVVRTLGFPPWRDQSWQKMQDPGMDGLRDSEGFAEFKR